jgi:Ca-activated chloride channel family protein
MRLEGRANETAPTSDTLSLEREEVSVTIDEQHATTVLTQHYFNRGSDALEGVCSVRVGQNSGVQGFAYWNGSEKIRGEVFEKQAAQAVYEQATGLRRDPGLLEQTGEAAFSFRVFPIQPKEHKRVEVTLTQRLAREAKTVEYRVPLASPGSKVRVTIGDSRTLGSPHSTTHDLDVQSADGKLIVVATPKTKTAKEFILSYSIEQAPYQLSVVKHEDVGQPAYLAISLATEAVVHPSPKDVTIVLDHSGSMAGTPLAEARAAAKEVVSRLGAADRLNVIAFDDGIDSLYSLMQPVTPKTRAEALAFLDKVQSGGGTDIALALQEALKRQRPSAERPIVLFLTDGESDAQAAFKVAESNRTKARVFTVGLGSGVNRALLSRLADLERGKFTYIQSAEAIRSSVAKLFRLVELAVIEGPEISIENGKLLHMQPSTLPDVAPGEELLVTARATGPGPVRIKFKGRGMNGPIEAQTTIALGSTTSKPWVGRLWAHERTNRLLEDISLQGENEELKNEVIELAVSYGFVTPYTAFLAIPESELTETTSAMMRDLRAKKRAILASRADAVALSRSDMPPGDPVLSVEAPSDALRVTAYFPFGLEKDLSYDPATRRWRVRFLVPKETPDGEYEVPVLVTERSGHTRLLTGKYRIDSEEPEFEPVVRCRDGKIEITVTTREPMREARAALVDDPKRRVELRRSGGDATQTHYVGTLRAPHSSRVRVVLTDNARNEADEVVSCPALEPGP